MLERALKGDARYWSWIFFLGAVIFVAFLFYLQQFHQGLTITGLKRDVTWGFYIAQFTFLVGVAASAIMMVLPYYLHNAKEFGKMTILGEFLAISSVIMCMTFIFVDMGQPFRILNVFLHPTPGSMMFWDTVALFGYLVLNVIISHYALDAEKKGISMPKWLRPIIILSIPWAISIHTVTAFLYAGLPGRSFWLTAILAPRFLASAFASGPAILILLALVIRKLTKLDPGKEAIQKMGIIVTYAMLLNVFFILMELFTAFYSNIPEHKIHFQYLLFGIDGKSNLVPWMWTSFSLAAISLVLLLIPKIRKKEGLLAIACVTVFASIWIDKGMGMVIAGFVPSPLGQVVQYSPTFPEIMISLGVYGMGFLLVTALYKIAMSVREELQA